MEKIHYIFDPLCGWCYASAPALQQLALAYPQQLELMPSGLFAEDGARDLTPQFAEYAWANDQRIETLTGQPFTEAYRQDVLLKTSARFDSAMMNRALTAVRELSPALEVRLLHQLQVARYVTGLDTATAAVVARITTEVATEAGVQLEIGAFERRLNNDAALLASTQIRTRATQVLMSQKGIRGVPQVLISVGGNVVALDSSLLYSDVETLAQRIRRG